MFRHHINDFVNGHEIKANIMSVWYIRCFVCHFDTKKLLGTNIHETHRVVKEVISVLYTDIQKQTQELEIIQKYTCKYKCKYKYKCK